MEQSNGTAENDAASTSARDVGSGSDPIKDGEAAATENKKCCNSFRFDGNPEAQGYALATVARGGIIMSNIFLSTAFIRLASEDAGCDLDETETEECNLKVYGFRPSSFVTMIAAVSGVLAAFLLPTMGAIIDYTPYRRAVGIFSAVFITVVQAVQIGIDINTWFAMAILQSINGFMYMVQVLAVYAYLPDIGREVGPEKMTSWSSLFTMYQFTTQAIFIVVNIGITLPLDIDDVAKAQVSQGICVLLLIPTFIGAWWKIPSIPALQKRPENKSLVRIGFSRVVKTVVGINKYYASGLRWYFLSVIFCEAGANAFTVVAVTFMVEALEMNASEIGIVFLITLVGTLPGSKIGELIANKTNPILSWKINLLVFSFVTAVGGFVMTGPESKNLCYFFGVLWGMLLGWFYPLENVVFAMTVPKGQEAELSGFYTYCRSILNWLPPLVFTVMNESGIPMKYGLLSIVGFLFIGLVMLQMMAPWEDVLEAAKVIKMTEVVPDKSKGEGAPIVVQVH